MKNATDQNISEAFRVSMEFSKYDSKQGLATAFGLSLTLLLNIIGNTLVIAVLFRLRKFKNLLVSNVLMSNLAFADLLMAFFVMPLSIYVCISRGWRIGDITCRMHGFMTVLVATASIMTLAAIGVDRYHAVCCTNRLKNRTAVILLVSVWTWAFLIAFAPASGWIKNLTYKFDHGSTGCKVTYSANVAYGMLAVLVSFLIPCFIMIYCYSCIFVKLYHHSKNIRKWDTSGMSLKSRNIQREQSTTKTVFVIMLIFILCWGPYYCILVIRIAGINIPASIYLFSSWATTVQAALNSIIYTKYNRKFRSQLYNMFPWSKPVLSRLDSATRPQLSVQQPAITERVSVSSVQTTNRHNVRQISVREIKTSFL